MSLATLSRRFVDDRAGAIAVVFALSLVPLVVAVGAAIDYARASSARSDLQSAIDAAALAVGRVAAETGSTDNKPQARQVFNAGFQRSDGSTVDRFDVVQDQNQIVIAVDVRVPLQFAGLLNRDSIVVSATATVLLGRSGLEVVLVLDNTLSMLSDDKMPALKRAAKGLIEKLQAASVANPNISIAVVPFAAQVKIPVTKPYPEWVRFTPSSSKEKVLTVPPGQWTGCIADRDQPYDMRDPLAATTVSKYPAAYCNDPKYDPNAEAYCKADSLSPVMPLTKNFAALLTAVEAMTPAGCTNTTIGLAWGFAALTPGAPLSGAAQQAKLDLRRHVVFLTDGDNTLNRWTNKNSQIDQRTALVCDEIKKAGIVLHTIRVMKGNETLLKNCASDPLLYHSVTQSSDLKPVFDKIATELMALRLAR